jgi:cytochrome c553
MAVLKELRRSRALLLASGAAVWVWAAATLAAAQTLEERLQVCGTCHGETGNSNMENVPSLAGQPALFLTNQLILMREKLRPVEAMEPFVKGLKDEEIVALAEHYAKLGPGRGDDAVDQQVVARGAQLAQQLHCASCHKAGYEGQEQMPRLVPQRIDYLIKSLTEYREGKRYGIDTSMNGVMYRVPDRDIRALAHYLGSLR